MEMFAHVDFVAVLAAGVAGMAFGFCWYSKATFGNAWMKASGTPDKKPDKCWLYMLGGLLSVLVQATVLSCVLYYMNITDMMAALKMAAVLWLGFCAVQEFGRQLWEKKPCALFWINGGYQLGVLLLMTAVLVWM